MAELPLANAIFLISRSEFCAGIVYQVCGTKFAVGDFRTEKSVSSTDCMNPASISEIAVVDSAYANLSFVSFEALNPWNRDKLKKYSLNS